MKYIFWIIVILVVVAIVNQPTPEQKMAKYVEEMRLIDSAKPEKFTPNGELAKIFSVVSEYTDIQRENAEKELIGRVVQWSLPVFDVKKDNDNEYTIQTSSVGYVGTFIHLMANSATEKEKIESLKAGAMITFKGKVKNVIMRHITIDPARIL